MLAIIAGWGKDAKPIAYVGIMKCPNCRNYDHFQLYEVAKKVSAFFVPVAKWARKYFMVCNVCEGAIEVTQSEKDQLLRESAEIPSVEEVMAIWVALDSTVQHSLESGGDVTPELEKALAQLEGQYPKSHVEYVRAVYAECSEDDDQPE